jgi:hypothetical protein
MAFPFSTAGALKKRLAMLTKLSLAGNNLIIPGQGEFG